MAIKQVICLAVLGLGLPLPGVAQTSQEVNEANNPLTPKLTVHLRDQYISSYYGLDSESNAILLRGVLPHKLFDWPQIVRATVPIVTSPDQPVDSTTGLGDINLFDVLLCKTGSLEAGVSDLLICYPLWIPERSKATIARAR
jgi:hypothetical protein